MNQMKKNNSVHSPFIQEHLVFCSKKGFLDSTNLLIGPVNGLDWDWIYINKLYKTFDCEELYVFTSNEFNENDLLSWLDGGEFDDLDTLEYLKLHSKKHYVFDTYGFMHFTTVQ